MAMVSEVSMNQANALKLQQSLKEKESELEQCYIRMEKGEPPSEEIEHDWLKFLRDNERRAYEHEEKRLVRFIDFHDIIKTVKICSSSLIGYYFLITWQV